MYKSARQHMVVALHNPSPQDLQQLPAVGLMIQMPSPNEPLFCSATPLPRGAMAWEPWGLQQSGAAACVLSPVQQVGV